MIPTVIEAAYPDWVRSQFAALSAEAEVEDTYVVVPKCPAGSRCCLLLTSTSRELRADLDRAAPRSREIEPVAVMLPPSQSRKSEAETETSRSGSSR
ncbi:hypothetical protein [Gaopeijia maritima]|uniref:hypothetical protein n=1 Tax=Gaopeijia maritima TaxID=3119007 RepID=UPI0038655FD7